MHDIDRTTLEYGSTFSGYRESPLASGEWEHTGGQSTVLEEILAEAQAEAARTRFFLGLDTFALDGNKVRDWVKAKEEGAISFAVFESNWGTFPARVFLREWPKIHEAGLVRGAYMFLRFPNPKNDRRYGPCPSPVDQAKTFIKTVGKLDQSDLPPSLDVEFPGDGRKITGLTARQCLDRVRAAWSVLKDFYGAAPIIYTSARVWHEDLNNLAAPDLVESPLWLAHYPYKVRLVARTGPEVGRLAPPLVPPPLGDPTNWWIHQYQGDALRLPGFATGNVDLNRFHACGRGAVGNQVKWVQRRLGIAQTGNFDATTEAGLRAFQHSKGIEATLMVDPRTFAFLCWSKHLAND
jgi:lysozyme